MESNAAKLPKKWLGLLGNLSIAILALGGAMTMQWTQLHQKLPELTPKQAQEQEALQLKLISHTPSLGFDNLIADWALLGFIQYFGDDDARKQSGYSLSVDYFDLITQRDPRFVDIYSFLSTAISFYLGKPEISLQLMDRGIKSLSPQLIPRAYLVWRYKALDQLLLLGDISGSIQSYEMAAKWAKRTPDESTAKFFLQSANNLKQDPKSTSVRFWAWTDVYQQSIDEKTRERAKQEIIKLGGEVYETQDGKVQFVAPPVNSSEVDQEKKK